MSAYKDIWISSKGLALVVSLLLSVLSNNALADRNITSVTVNGGSTTTVVAGSTITVVVNVTTDGTGSLGRWRCTSISNLAGSVNLDHEPDHDNAGNYSEIYSVTAPSTLGTYSPSFVAYRNDGCDQGASNTYTLTNGVVVVPPAPAVTSINRASGDPASPGSLVSWQVVFNQSVTGVDAGDFLLVSGGAVSGATITTVTGSGTTWTVTANTGTGPSGTLQLNLVDDDTITAASGGQELGGAGVGNGNFAGQNYTIASSTCTQPANTPAGLNLTCQCDSFGRTNLNPSPMFTSSNWIVSTSDSTGVVPYINASTGFLRLTENTGNNAKAATVPGFFPAAGNYISVEFKHYAYNGSGADGIAVTLSDYSVAAVPGAYGGSLGYAQKTGISGFAGGWIGVGIDEYGNFSNPSEGRVGGAGFVVDGIAVRGSGSGTTGYPYLGGTAASLSPGVDNAGSSSPAPGHFYQVIVDARNSASGQTWVAVNRDTGGTGNSYSSLVSSFDAFARAAAVGYTQAAVPANWQLSFTGSTGGATNKHELGKVRICAQYFVPPDGGTAGGFSAIDDAYTSNAVQNFLSGHIYTKLVNTPFKLKVAALSNSQILTTYAAGATKNVTVKLVDNSDGLCGTDAERVNSCALATCNGKAAVGGGSQTLSFLSTDKGIKTTADFTLNKAWANLVAVISDGTTTACSVDSFSVRPTLISSVTSSAGNTGLTGTPSFKAGTDSFTLTATANAGGYNGTPQINPAAMTVNPAGGVVGAFTPALFPAATAGSGATSVATGSFTYSEVGNFRFLGYDPASNTTSARGIYDDSWTTVDSISTKNDCVAASYANTKDSSGKYGCLFGLFDGGAATPNSPMFGRFVPDHFTYLGGGLTPACSTATTPFSYMGQPKLGIAYRLRAENGSNAVTVNYHAARGYPVGTVALVAEDQATTNQGCDLASRISGVAAGSWVNGVYAVNDAGGDNIPDTATSTFSRPVAPLALTAATCAANRASAGGPFLLLDIGVAVTDPDAGMSGLDMDAATAGTCSTCTARRIGTTAMLDGRLKLSNAYGSELLPLPVPVQAQVWSASGWQKNSLDVCTGLTQPTIDNAGLLFYADSDRNKLASGEVVAQMNGVTTSPVVMSAGDGRLVLRHPTDATKGPGTDNYGYVDIVGSVLGAGLSSWLPPTGNARACFGSCGPRSPVIYFRERY